MTVHIAFSNHVEYPGTERKREPYTTDIWWQDNGNTFRFAGKKKGTEHTILLNKDACFSWSGKDGKIVGDVTREPRDKYPSGDDDFSFLPTGVTSYFLQAAKGYLGLLKHFTVALHVPIQEGAETAWFTLKPKPETPDTSGMGAPTLRIAVNTASGLPVGLVVGDQRRILRIEATETAVNGELPEGLFASPDGKYDRTPGRKRRGNPRASTGPFGRRKTWTKRLESAYSICNVTVVRAY
ncbi:MAG: hypothetical protein HYV36_08710 [Lentisphaerae bacterium]|nr:hypothetical protein [Lentisphaerota bacterium]